ncbi:MAG: hypothetical protein HY288_01385 [Planctomycetia bacterium]|nr:hypothetical protein [Planctomycetia bacterium]
MSTSSVQLLEGGGLGVRFAFRDDRYAHEISLTDGSRWIPILMSVEGSPLDDWPASPPLQSLHLDSRPGNRQLALLVGMAGHSHWSFWRCAAGSESQRPQPDRRPGCKRPTADGPLGIYRLARRRLMPIVIAGYAGLVAARTTPLPNATSSKRRSAARLKFKSPWRNKTWEYAWPELTRPAANGW